LKRFNTLQFPDMKRSIRYAGFLVAFGLVTCLSVRLQAQDYTGFSGSNYAGVHGVYFNPASIADSRYAVDVNVVGFSFQFANDFLELRNDGFLGIGNLGESYDDWTDFRQKALIVNFDGARSGQKANVFLGIDVMGPSALISLSPKDAIALGVRYRALVNFDEVGAEAARLAIDEFVYPPLWGRNFESDGASLDAMTWIEYFGSYGRTVWQDGEHVVKAGVTLKLLQGAAALYLHADELNYNFTNDDILTLEESTIQYGHTDNFDVNREEFEIKFFSTLGFGADLGLIYEWRPEGAAYSGRMRDETVASGDRSATRYKLRVGASLMDFGGVRFDRDPKSYDRPAGAIDIDDWDLTVVEFDALQDFDDTLNIRFPEQAGDLDEKFGMNLPLALNLHADYQLYKGLYVGAAAWLAPKSPGDVNKVHGITRLSLNPRFEHRWFEAGLPLSYQNFSGTDFGMYLRLGPVVLGSANFFTEAFSDGVESINAYMALKIPLLYGRSTSSVDSEEYNQY